MRYDIIFIPIFSLALLHTIDCCGQNVAYSDVYKIACHNCFEPQYASNIEDVLPYTKTIELDIWDTRMWFGIGGWKALNKDWYVRHIATDKANVNCCGGTLRDCLNRIKLWSDQHKDHDVLTVFLDKKENWSESNETRRPADLDELLSTIFPQDRIIKPAKILRQFGNLKESVEKLGWPPLDSLKGKIIFVITKSTEFTQRNVLNEYIDSQQHNSMCFVAPEIISSNEVETPNGISQNNAPNVVFYNLKYNDRNLVNSIRSKNCLSRIYGAPENSQTLKELIDLKINFIAMFNYKITL